MYKWISIKDGLPPIGAPLIVTIHDTMRQRRELRYPVYYRHSMYGSGYGFYQYGEAGSYLTPEYSPVLAWMKVPQVWDGVAE